MLLQTKQIYTGGISQPNSLVGRHLVLHPITPASLQDVGLFLLLLLPCTSSENHQTPDWPTSTLLQEKTPNFFFCLVNKMHQHPGKCGKYQSWLRVRGPFGGSRQSTHPGPCAVSRVPGCSPRATWADSGNGSERAREEQWRNCYITLSKQLSSQPFTYFFSRWALRSLAVVIQDIPAPPRTGTNQLHSWQKRRGNSISHAIKQEAQYLHLKTLRIWV